MIGSATDRRQIPPFHRIYLSPFHAAPMQLHCNVAEIGNWVASTGRVVRKGQSFDDIHWRVYVKSQQGWTGGGPETLKLDFSDPSNPAKTVDAPITSEFPPGVGATTPIVF